MITADNADYNDNDHADNAADPADAVDADVEDAHGICRDSAEGSHHFLLLETPCPSVCWFVTFFTPI